MVKPVIMGGAMGVMMLWMLHGVMTGDGVSLWAGVVFVAAHGVVAGVVILSAVFAARLSPGMRRALARVHRPTPRHVAVMLGSAALVIGVVHLGAHGFGGL